MKKPIKAYYFIYYNLTLSGFGLSFFKTVAREVAGWVKGFDGSGRNEMVTMFIQRDTIKYFKLQNLSPLHPLSNFHHRWGEGE